jgi:hypothetical protein
MAFIIHGNLSLATPALKFLTDNSETDREAIIHHEESEKSTISQLQATLKIA